MGINYGDKRLLDRYNLSTSCLDYSFIRNSTNEKELEDILRILRSGEEGHYPDLTQFCEARLGEISPKNKLLQVIKSVSSLVDLPSEDQSMLRNDIKTWIEDIKVQDRGLVAAPNRAEITKSYPIRNASKMNDKKESKEKRYNMDHLFKSKSKLLSYEDWDKFDAQKALENVDKVRKVDEKRNSSINEMEENKPLLPVVNVSGLSDDEKMSLADKEKNKGNECFKAQDYSESAFYYSRSISAYPTAAALNNRAFAFIKLKKYTAALVDCDEALHLEPYNVKALYRRGLAYQETGRMQLAYMDFQNALDIDPNCKAAKEKLQEMEKCPMPKSSTNKSLVIEELVEEGTVKHTKGLQDQIASTYEDKQNVSSSHCIEPICVENQICNESPEKCPRIEQTADVAKAELPSSESYEKKRKIIHSELKAKPTGYDDTKNSAVSSADADVAMDRSPKIKTENLDRPIANVKCVESQLVENPTPLKDVETQKEMLKSNIKHSLETVEPPSHRMGFPKRHIPRSMLLPDFATKENAPISDSVKDKMTPFRFLNLWHSSDASKNSKAGAELLRKILPEKLPLYITNKLDGDILNGIILAMKEIVHSGDWLKGYSFMKQLVNIPRIKTISSFLSATEQKEIQDLLFLIEENQRTEMVELKETILEKTLTKYAK